MSAHQALVLNADYRPLSLFPLSLWSWQDAVQAVFRDRVVAVKHYDREVRSPSTSIRLPSVIALRRYVHVGRDPALTRYHIFLRDDFACQYCAAELPAAELTFDHVVPRCEGGLTTWENIAAACPPCNLRKGAKSLAQSGMRLMREPRCPSQAELLLKENGLSRRTLHEDWVSHIYWSESLDP